MLPMQILYGALDTPVSVEVKSGECFNGHIQSADYFMNLKLRDVIVTDPHGEKFWRVPECFIRGNNVKYVRVCQDAVGKAEAQKNSFKKHQPKTRGKIRGSSRGR